MGEQGKAISDRSGVREGGDGAVEGVEGYSAAGNYLRRDQVDGGEVAPRGNGEEGGPGVGLRGTERFQWSRDSKTLYLIKDQYYRSQGSQLFSAKGELWKYEVETQSLQPVLRPFPAYSYFFGLKSGIYFSVPTDRGDLQLKYFDGSRVTDVGTPNAEIPIEKLATNFIEKPFFSFSIVDYEIGVLPARGVRFIFEKGLGSGVDREAGPEEIEIGGKTIFTLTPGKGFKGFSYCTESLRSVFLPGDRYFLMNVPYCGNYQGQLLIDTVTGNYEGLPKDSRVYLTLNTETVPHYRVTGGGITVR